MSDPFLYELMHRISPTMVGQDNDVETDRFKVFFEKAVQEKVNQIVQSEGHPESSLLPLDQLRLKVEKEVRESAHLGEFEEYIRVAIRIFRLEGLRYLEQNSYQQLMDGLNEVREKLKVLDLHHISEESLHQALSMPSNASDCILKIGIQKHTEGLLHDSLATFSFLTLVFPDEPAFWYRLGMAAQENKQYSLALRAYQVSLELAPDFIGAAVFSGECHFHLGQINEAKRYLLQARELIEEQKDSQWHSSCFALETLILS